MASIKKNFAYNILLAVSQVFFPLVTFPYVTRVLGPESLGIVSFVDSFAGYFILIAALGIPVYGVREIAKHKQKEDQSRIFSEIFSIHAILTVFSLAIYFVSVFFYPNFISTYQLFLWGGIM
nr:oligosaccharide flippase family protein [Cloacibacterium sp.]